MKRLLALIASSLLLVPAGPCVADSPSPGMHTLSLTNAEMDQYVGKYASSRSGITYIITRNGRELDAQIVGQQAAPIYASRPDHFFYTTVRAYIEFVREDSRVVGLVLTQHFRTFSIPKLGADGKPLVADVLPQYPPSIVLGENMLRQYAGRYRASTAQLTIAESSGHMFIAIAGQEALEVYPSSNDDFYYKDVDALVHFNRDASGRITSLMFTQNGYTLQYERE